MTIIISDCMIMVNILLGISDCMIIIIVLTSVFCACTG